jgi:hypothetical protein
MDPELRALMNKLLAEEESDKLVKKSSDPPMKAATPAGRGGRGGPAKSIRGAYVAPGMLLPRVIISCDLLNVFSGVIKLFRFRFLFS